jgi:hypothetical protein
MADLESVGGLPGGAALREFLQIAHQNDGTVVAVGGGATDLEGWYSVKDYGALGNNSADDGPAINDAIDAMQNAAGGVLFFPPGTYKITTALTVPSGKAIYYLGVGSGQTSGSSNATRSVLYFPTDLGSGTYAINATNGWSTTGVEGLKILGPNENPAKGAAVHAMDGIRFGPNQIIRDVVVSGGFHAGLVEVGDHAHLYNVRSGAGNYYGLYYPGSSVVSHGDNSFVGCNFAGCAMASVGAHGNNEVGGDDFFATHFGFAPYGFYKEAAGTDANFIINCHFIRSSIEQVGNAAIYDSTGAGVVKGNEWHQCGVTIDSAYRYSTDGGLKRGWIDVAYLQANTWSLGNLGFLPQYGVGTDAHVYTSADCTGNRFSFSGYSGNSKPFFGGTLLSPLQNEVWEDGYRLRYRPYQIAATVAAGDCVEITRVSASMIGVQKAVSGSGKPLAGMVVESAVPGAGGVGMILVSGRYAAAAGPVVEGAVSAGDRLTPDGCSTSGHVKTVANSTDRVFAVAAGDVTDGSRCTPILSLGP